MGSATRGLGGEQEEPEGRRGGKERVELNVLGHPFVCWRRLASRITVSLSDRDISIRIIYEPQRSASTSTGHRTNC